MLTRASTALRCAVLPWYPRSLWQNNVGNEGCAYISESLRTNTTLTQLNLRANRIEVDFEDEICGVTADRENWELKIAD